MTLSDLSDPFRNKFLFIVLLVISSKLLSAQTPDTLVIYEYVYVTDTIWLDNGLQGDTALIPCLLPDEITGINVNFTENTATNLKNTILMENPLEMKHFKKKQLFTFIMFGLPAFTLAQNYFNLKAGSNFMWLQHGAETISNTPWTGASVGADFNHKMNSSNFYWSLGLFVKYGDKLKNYYQIKEPDATLSAFEYEFASIKTQSLLGELNTGDFMGQYFSVSVPFKISYHFQKIHPFAGVQIGLSNIKNSFHTLHQLEVPFGMACFVNKHWGLELEGVQSIFTYDNTYNDNLEYSLGTDDYRFRTFTFNGSIVYIF